MRVNGQVRCIPYSQTAIRFFCCILELACNQRTWAYHLLSFDWENEILSREVMMKGGLVLTYYLEKMVGVGGQQGNYNAIKHIHSDSGKEGETLHSSFCPGCVWLRTTFSFTQPIFPSAGVALLVFREGIRTDSSCKEPFILSTASLKPIQNWQLWLGFATAKLQTRTLVITGSWRWRNIPWFLHSSDDLLFVFKDN